jgi:SAM-dependent methyltransferase
MTRRVAPPQPPTSPPQRPWLYRVFARVPEPIRSRLRWLWHRLLDALSTRTWVREFAIPLLMTAFIRAVAALFQDDKTAPLRNNAFTEVTFDVLVLLATMVFVRWTITWNVPEMTAAIRDIASATQPPGRGFLRDFATQQILQTRDIINGLTGPGHYVASPSAMRPWFVRFFAEGGGTYVGVDSHLPSEFMNEYEWYLEVHAANLKERGSPGGDQRIISTTEPAIARERRGRQQRPVFQRFFRWHQDNDVEVSWVDASLADGMRSDYNISNADIGLWEKFAVAFETDRQGGARLSMWFPNEPRRRNTTYEQISRFVSQISGKATPLEQVAPGLSLVDRELADAWIAYVDPDKRLAGGVGKFLVHALGDRRSVFDAAAGVGCDSVYLMSHGYYVVTNEVDELLLAQAQAYANEKHAKLDFKTVFWEDLPGDLPGGQRFDAVLCLGNSLCLVDDASGRAECIEAFYDCLYPDGVLVIDERNFQYMLDNAQAINRDPMGAFPATLEGDVMYRGRKVRGYPARISRPNRTVNWCFFYNDPPVREKGELDDRRFTNELVLHTFEQGELFRLIQDAGFMAIDVYADLKLVSADAAVMPSVKEIGDANFITYVAHKGGREVNRRTRDHKAADTPVAPGA